MRIGRFAEERHISDATGSTSRGEELKKERAAVAPRADVKNTSSMMGETGCAPHEQGYAC